jgi:hypothetical protein
MSSKKLLLTLVLLGLTAVAFAEVTVKDLGIVTPQSYAVEKPVYVDTIRMKNYWNTHSGTIRDIAVGKYLKGPNDETTRVFITNSASPRRQLLYTDTTTVQPPTPADWQTMWRTEMIESSGVGHHAAAIGDIDNDGQNEIVFGRSSSPYRLKYAKWDGTQWKVDTAATVAGSIYEAVVGDADNDGSNEILFTNGNALMMAKWNSGTGTFDTTRIWTGGGTLYGIGIGDVDPNLPGKEVYLANYAQQFVQAYWTGSTWQVTVIHTYPSDVDYYDLAVGDYDPTNPGDEVAINNGYGYATHGNFFLYKCDGTTWYLTRFTLYTSWSTLGEIAIGKVFDFTNQNVIIATPGGTAGRVQVLWNEGGTWYAWLQDAQFGLPILGGTCYSGIGIGDINKWRATSNGSLEFVIGSGSTGSQYPFLYQQQFQYNTDAATANLRLLPQNYTAHPGEPVTIKVTLINTGYNPITSCPISYTDGITVVTETWTGNLGYFQSEEYTFTTPYTPSSTGPITITCYSSLLGEEYPADDTTRATLEVFPTTLVCAQTFNLAVFPPYGWDTTRVSGTSVANRWTRVTSGSNPTCTPYEGAGMAMYNSYSAPAGQMARLRTHPINTGTNAVKCSLSFYMYNYTLGNDSLIIQYSLDGNEYFDVARLPNNTGSAGWSLKQIEIGDFPPNTDIYIGFLGKSAYGYNMFIDMVSVWFGTPTSPVRDIGVDQITFPGLVLAGNSYPVTVRIKNYGLAPAPNPQVSYDPGDGSPVITETYPGTIPPLSFVSYTFTQEYMPTTYGDYTLKVYTSFTGDENNTNDTAYKAFHVGPEVMPFSESFEGATFPPAYWTTQIISGTYNWVRVTSGSYPTCSPYDGSYMIQYQSFSASSGSQARIYTPYISLPAFSLPALAFAMYHDPGYPTNYESVYVEVSTNGTDWEVIGGFQRYDANAGWQLHSIDLSAYAGNNVMIGFRAVSKYGNNMYLDLIEVKNYRDVGVTAITTPPEGTIGGAPIIPQVTVTNFGGQTEDIPVTAEIWTQAQGLYESFEGSFPPEGWVVYNNDGGTKTWTRSTIYYRTGVASATSTYESSTLRNDDWLVTPKVRINPGDNLSFWYRTSISGNDSMEVWLSTTGNTIPDFTVMLDAFGIRNTSYLEKVISLNDYAGMDVYIAFVNKGLYQWTISIDDVTIGYVPPQMIYTATTTVEDVEAQGGTGEAYFDEWIPQTGTYLFKAYTTLAADMTPTNDLMTRTFSVDATPPDVPTLQTPENEATTNAYPQFTWTAVSDAVLYNIVVRTETEEVIINTEVEENAYEHGTALDEGTYYWKVRAKDAYDNWSDFSTEWTFTVDATPPEVPTPISPAEGDTVQTEITIFTWSAVSGAAGYEIVIDDVAYQTTNTTYQKMLGLGPHTWKVRAKDAVNNWSDYSATINFYVKFAPWAQLESMPQVADLNPGKYVKDGGALVATNNVLFAFPGNKSCRFFKYTPGTGWAEVESIPYAYKYKPGQPIDSTTVNKKKVAKGASLCWDGENFIYATKGNGTYEFWKYDILNDTWILLPYVPTTKGLKGGTSIAYDDGYVYLLAGGQKQATHEFFFRYSVTDNTWQTLAKPVIGVKDWKDGSAIAAYGNKVYAMKGGDKPNYFLTYDITQGS